MRLTRILCAACIVLTATPLAHAAVRGWEGTITLPTYPWEDDVNPRFQELDGSIIYPYTMQDRLALEKVDREYKALFLENEYLRLICLPELGGRIHSVFDKAAQTEMFHLNHVIKPGLIALRGAWISGGIEWNRGPQGHTVTIVSPVDARVIEHSDGSASFFIGTTEQNFRTRWDVQLTLHPGKKYLDQRIRIYNPTDGVHAYYFWNNTAFPNTPGTRFIYPMTLGTDHDGKVFFRWPVDEGVDLTWLKNYDRPTSVFAYQCVYDFFGAYDVDRDYGIVQYANHRVLPGKKAWTWGTSDDGLASQAVLTDNDGPYIEVQSGPLLTQADFALLGPQESVEWQEWWYPVHGLGDGYEYANRDLAFNLVRGDAAELRIAATGTYRGAAVTVSQHGKTIARSTLDLRPEAAAVLLLGTLPEGAVEVAVTTAEGVELARYTSPLPIPHVDPPVESEPAKPDTIEAQYLAAREHDKQMRPAEALQAYTDVLASDPAFTPARRARGILHHEAGRYPEAIADFQYVVERNPDDSMAWYHLAAAQLVEGDSEAARVSAYTAVRTVTAKALGYDVAGRAAMRMGDVDEAVAAFEQALAWSPQASRIEDRLILARDAAGLDTRALRNRARMERPLALVPQLETPHADRVRALRKPTGEDEFEFVETAWVYADLGLYAEAAALLEAFCASGPHSALPRYAQAYFTARAGDSEAAMALLDTAGTLSPDYVFPSRHESVAAFRYAVETQPGDASAQLYLGNLYAGLGRVDDAAAAWQAAAENDAGLSVAWRNLGVHAWKKASDLKQPEAHFRKGLEARPDDQILFRDLAHVLIADGRRGEAIALLESMPEGMRPRTDILTLLARAYLDEKRYDDALGLLENAAFSNWEGNRESWRIFSSAHLERGKMHFEKGEFEAALADFSAGLTYPENLNAGRPAEPDEAELWHWKGRALAALGRTAEAKAAWETGAADVQHPETWRQKNAEAARTGTTPHEAG